MMTIIMVFLFLFCTVFVFLLIRDTMRNRDTVRAEYGNPVFLILAEAVVYFFGALGISDFAFNTPIFRKFKLVEDECLPGSLVTCSVVPGMMIAVFYLSGAVVEIKTLLLCVAIECAGVILGVMLVSKMKGNKIRIFMGIAMLISIVFILLKVAVSGGATSTGQGLTNIQLFIALPILFILGVLNMIGFGMKAPAIALLLILGMNPMCVLTVVLSMACMGTITGGIQYIRSGRYKRKLTLCASIGGTAGASLGGLFVKSLNTSILQWAMILILSYTAYNMLAPDLRLLLQRLLSKIKG